MSSIFLSYRREDAEGQAGRLYDDLVAVFGADSVFMDVATIQPGRDFRKSIDQSLGSCGVFLALIGKTWLTATDASGQRRLDDPADFVRIETAAALKRDIPVIPVLVQGAPAPKSEALPDDLKDLAYRNATELTHLRWDSDIKLLINALRPHVSAPSPVAASNVPAPKGPNKNKLLAFAAVAVLIIVGLVLYLRPAKKIDDTSANQSPAAAATQPAANGIAPAPTKHSPQKAAHFPSKDAASNEPFQNQTNANPKVDYQAPNAAGKPFQPKNAFSLAAEQRLLSDNPKRFSFTLSLNASDQTIADISSVHYDLVYDANPLSLDGGPAPAFSAVYEGWGCYEKVVVTVDFKSPAVESQKQTFNMCKVLNP